MTSPSPTPPIACDAREAERTAAAILFLLEARPGNELDRIDIGRHNTDPSYGDRTNNALIRRLPANHLGCDKCSHIQACARANRCLIYKIDWR
jgi:hypothetical protein